MKRLSVAGAYDEAFQIRTPRWVVRTFVFVHVNILRDVVKGTCSSSFYVSGHVPFT